MFDINSIPGLDAQLAHAFAGAFLVLALSLFLNPALAIAIATGISFGKEALEAIGIAPWEPKQTWASSMVDFGFFGAGILLSFVLLLLKILG